MERACSVLMKPLIRDALFPGYLDIYGTYINPTHFVTVLGKENYNFRDRLLGMTARTGNMI